MPIKRPPQDEEYHPKNPLEGRPLRRMTPDSREARIEAEAVTDAAVWEACRAHYLAKNGRDGWEQVSQSEADEKMAWMRAALEAARKARASNDSHERKPMITTQELLATADASVWAKAFKAQFGDNVVDEDTMHGWFANAMCAEGDALLRRQGKASNANVEALLAKVPCDENAYFGAPLCARPGCRKPKWHIAHNAHAFVPPAPQPAPDRASRVEAALDLLLPALANELPHNADIYAAAKAWNSDE